MKKNCERCKIEFEANPIIKGDDVCRTCERLNDITFWYPVLFRAKIPVPKTIIIHTNLDLEPLGYGENVEEIEKFIMHLKEAVCEVGTPAFLRTGYSSNKHDWERSCFVSKEDAKNNLLSHVRNLVEHSSIMTIDRFSPCDFWAVREFITAKKYFNHFHGNMPITKERRFFVRDGKVECSHSYWPPEVFKGKTKEEIAFLNEFTDEDKKTMFSMAQYISGKFSGFWSVDFLLGENGTWYVTDMAIGEGSYHQEHKKNREEKETNPLTPY